MKYGDRSDILVSTAAMSTCDPFCGADQLGRPPCGGLHDAHLVP
jgi:hypothetical protein